MDAIIDRLAAIEQSAARLIDSAASEKKRLEKQFHAAIARYDAEVDRRTAEKQQALRKELDAQMTEELLQMKRETEKSLLMIKEDYEKNHETLAENILQKIIKR